MKKPKVPVNRYEITAITKGGEAVVAQKVNPKRRHSANNTIIGWNVYENGCYKHTLYK